MKKEKNQLHKAKMSLENMLETLRPFLPKVDLSGPEPAHDWKVTDAPTSTPATSQDSNFVRPF